MLETFTETTFADKVGDTFRVEIAPGQTIDLRLDQVRRLTDETAVGAVRPTKRAPFALIFLGPGTPPLPQQIYPISHDALGQQAIFIVPVGTRDGRRLYEAVFA